MLKKVSLILFSVSLLGITFMPFITSALGPLQISTLQLNQGMITQEVPDSFTFEPAFIPNPFTQEVKIDKILRPGIEGNTNKESPEYGKGYIVHDQNNNPDGPSGFKSVLQIDDFTLTRDGTQYTIPNDNFYIATFANNLDMKVDANTSDQYNSHGVEAPHFCSAWKTSTDKSPSAILDNCESLYELTPYDPVNGNIILSAIDDYGPKDNPLTYSGRIGAYSVGLGLRAILPSDSHSPKFTSLPIPAQPNTPDSYKGTLTFTLTCYRTGGVEKACADI
ncbi:MAG TPA: hypothetical protein P5229_04480 [Candidatus Gracilibacteria bacterium]|nr:hypothetical protein [Candidatus Gracilibacteria bacterium]